MKEDILEQIADDWFLSNDTTFTKHNVKFKPHESDEEYIPKLDSSYSDIDVLAVHLNKSGVNRVSAASCKSWQSGFNPKQTMNYLLNNPYKKVNGREIWKAFRELINKKWGKAYSRKIYEETANKEFTYYLFVTKIVGNKNEDLEKSKSEFQACKTFINNLKYDDDSKVKIKLVDVRELFMSHYLKSQSTTLASTELGRLIQVIKASGIKFNEEIV